MIKKLDKTAQDAYQCLESNEEWQVLLSSNGASSRCPSLHLSYEDAKTRLLQRGMTRESLDQLEGYLRALARHFISNELRK